MNYEPVWLGVCFGYKGILLLLGLLLAYDTRNVKLKEVTDSKFVALCIYNIVVRACACACATSSPLPYDRVFESALRLDSTRLELDATRRDATRRDRSAARCYVMRCDAAAATVTRGCTQAATVSS